MSIIQYFRDFYYTYIYSSTVFQKDTRFYYLSLIKETDGYSIHGLWPQTSSIKYPTYCKKVDFYISTLTPIMNELEENWYSTEEKNQDFWKHEWEKHGSCVFTYMTEFDYFKKTLDLFKEAKEKGLPDKYYNKEHNNCLIPVNLDFTFREQDL